MKRKKGRAAEAQHAKKSASAMYCHRARRWPETDAQSETREHIHRATAIAGSRQRLLKKINAMIAAMTTANTASVILIQLLGYSPAISPVTPLITT